MDAELCIAELTARTSHEHPDMPWDFHVDMARQATTRMNQLVDQLLELARAQTGSITVSATPVQLDRLAREVIDRYRAAAATKHLTIVLGASAEDISILGDPERLAQVLGNLVRNARRARELRRAGLI